MTARESSHHRRPGTMYVAVLGCAMVVTVIGVSAILVTRVEGRVMRGSADLAAARNLAQSSVDMGLAAMYGDLNWRTSKVQGSWKSGQAAGDGSISLSVTDPVDGVLSDTKWEPIVFTGTGAVRDAQYRLEATTIAQPLPLPALNTCLHSGGNVTINKLNSITVSGAPLSLNGSISGLGTVIGDVQAGSLGALPIVIGTSTIPSPAREMPDANIFDMYRLLAVEIPATSNFDIKVLTSDYNPWGTANPDGVYFMDATGDVTFKRSRIEGTLVVRCPSGKKVTIDKTLFLKGFRADYPTLIVQGDVVFNLDSDTTLLSENGNGTNYNPVGAPYLGVADSDKTDTYPNEIQGLVHVTGAVELSSTTKFQGVMIVEGNVTVTGTPQIIFDSKYGKYPPMGYVTYAMQIAHGSWRRVVNP